MTCGVYEIWCGPYFYQGSSKNIEARWTTHRRALTLGNHGNPKFQAAYNKYGWTDAGILVECEEHTRFQWEQDYIDANWGDEKYLNLTREAGPPPNVKGIVRDAAYKEKMRQVKAAWHAEHPEHGATTAARNKARVWTDEAREKARSKSKGHNPTPEARANMSAAQKARPPRPPPSPEARAKMSAAAKARCARRKGMEGGAE